MPINISVSINIADTLAKLNGQAKQLPFAAALALTRTAQAVQAAQVKEMVDVFDRPKPWTLGGVGYSPADKTSLSAAVFLKDRRAVSTGHPADKYLTPQIAGGSRQLKAFELAFRAAGVLPSSYYMVPGQGMRLDEWGNIPTGDIVKLLSYFRAFGEQGFSANTTDAGRAKLAKGQRGIGTAYFAVQPGGHLAPGIYRRFTGSGRGIIKPLIMFVSSVHYEPIYPFEDVGRQTVARVFPDELAKATQRALATAR